MLILRLLFLKALAPLLLLLLLQTLASTASIAPSALISRLCTPMGNPYTPISM